MELIFAGEHISIRQFDPVTLPDFAILTGRNGSGKTHLLQAIQNGNCRLDDFATHEIQYFNFQSFFVPNVQGPIPNQIQQLTAQGFAEYQQNWLPSIQQIFASVNVDWKATAAYASLTEFYSVIDDFWSVKPRSKQTHAHIHRYRESLNGWLSDPSNIPRTSQFPAIWSLIQKCKKPPHLIDRDTFDGLFSPIQNPGSILGFSLSTTFSKFIIDEFNWSHNEFEAGRSGSKAKSKAVFRSKIQPPWIPINKLLDEMGKMSASREAFRFEITTPDDNPIKIQDVQNYTFIANLRNKITGDICNFDNLSSGEKVLLAVVVSIYYSNETFMLPRALLLDEVDASLHPSMIKVLLAAIHDAFVAKGTKVIMATHSPTTVALAPDGSLYSVQAGSKQKKVLPISKHEGLSLLTEGFATFDEGLEALKFSGESLIIFTEGGNRKILGRFLELSGIANVKFIDTLDDKSSKEQLVHYYKLISALGLNRKALFVWDCDAVKEVGKLDETDTLFKFVIPQNIDNQVAPAGIENAFKADLLLDHCKKITDADGKITHRFDNAHKKRFTDKIAKSEDLSAFNTFQSLENKVREIVRM